MLKSTLLLITTSLIMLPTLKAGMSEEQATVAITTFLADPLSATSADNAKQIVQYGEETPDHEVIIEPKYMPWLEASKPPEGSELLLAAFIAGNLKEQIKKHSAKAEPYAGALSVIDVYSKIKMKTIGFRIDSVERWISLEKQGKLKAFIEKE